MNFPLIPRNILNEKVKIIENKVFIPKIGLLVKNRFTDKLPRIFQKVLLLMKRPFFDLLINYREKLESFILKSVAKIHFYTFILI